MSERERKVCQERERASHEKQRDAIANVGSGMQRRESENEKKKTGRDSTRRQQRPSYVATSDAGVATMEVGVQTNIKKRFLVGRGNWLGNV